MDTPRLSPRFRLAAVLALLAIVVAGCGGTGPVGRGPVATVNGTEISRSDIDTMIDAQQELIELGAAQAREQVESGVAQFTLEDVDRSLDEQLAMILGTGSGTVSADAAARQLDEMVQIELLHAALDEVGGEVTDEHRAQARAALEADIQQSGLDLQSVPGVIIDHYVELTAADAALAAAVPAEVGADLGMSPDDYEQLLRDTFEANGASYRQICFVGPVFDDGEAAEAAFGRIEDGDDLAAVVDDLGSDDPALAVSLDSCETLAAGSLVEFVGEDAFTAEDGHVFSPVELPQTASDGSSLWIVVVVESVDVPTFDDVRDQLTQDFPDTTQTEIDAARQQYLADVMSSVVEDAEVTIDPRYGTWDAATGSVVPPEDPGASSVPTDDLGDLELVEPTQ